MAGEISSAGVKILYAPESTAGTMPSTGFKQKATGATLNIADYITGVSGLGADYDMLDVTPLSEPERHRFIRGLQNNDGSIELSANINPTSRADWAKIVAEYAALTGGKALWFEFILPGDTEAIFVRGEPLPMRFPDVEAGSAVQGAVQIVENQYADWTSAITS